MKLILCRHHHRGSWQRALTAVSLCVTVGCGRHENTSPGLDGENSNSGGSSASGGASGGHTSGGDTGGSSPTTGGTTSTGGDSSGTGGDGQGGAPPLQPGTIAPLIIEPQAGPIILHADLQLAPRDDGGVYVTGRGGQITYGEAVLPSIGPFLFAVDAEGDFVWAANMAGSAQSTIEAITSDSEGNVIVGGTFTESFTVETESWTAGETYGDMFIAKYDRDGNFLWARAFSTPETDRFLSLATASDGAIYAAGYVSDDLDFGLGLRAMNENDAFVLKLHPNGSTAWVQSFQGAGTYRLPFGMGLADDGDVLIAGWLYGQATFGAFDIGETDEFRGFWARLTPEGAVTNAFDSDIYGAYHVAGTGHGGLWVAGIVDESAEFAGLSIDGGSGQSGFLALLEDAGHGVWAHVPVPGSSTILRPAGAGSAYIAGGSLSSGTTSGYRGRVSPSGVVEELVEFASASVHDIALAPGGTLWLSAELDGQADFGDGAVTSPVATHAIVPLRPVSHSSGFQSR